MKKTNISDLKLEIVDGPKHCLCALPVLAEVSGMDLVAGTTRVWETKRQVETLLRVWLASQLNYQLGEQYMDNDIIVNGRNITSDLCSITGWSRDELRAARWQAAIMDEMLAGVY